VSLAGLEADYGTRPASTRRVATTAAEIPTAIRIARRPRSSDRCHRAGDRESSDDRQQSASRFRTSTAVYAAERREEAECEGKEAALHELHESASECGTGRGCGVPAEAET